MISHHGLRVWTATAAARVHDDGARHGRVGSPSAVPPHVRCLARHSAAGSLPALAGAPHPPMSPTAGAHWLHRRRHAVVVVASQSVRSVGKKKLGTFRVAQRGSNDVNARAGALVLYARRNATSLQNHQSPRSARARRRRPLQLIWRIHTYRHHTAASSLNFRESEAIG